MEYLKPENWMVETEIAVARMLTDLATKEPDPQDKEAVRDNGSKAKLAEDVKKGKAPEETDEVKVGTSASQTSIGRKGKQILTEAERAAKKLRRILANRETARRAFLRRQALREELAQKVAALSSENKRMKMEKARIMQEFISLKETNRRLKEQLAQLSVSQEDSKMKQPETEPSLEFSTKLLGPMHAEMAHYMWVPWTPCMQNYIMCNPTASFSDPSLGLSSNSSLNRWLHETPSSSRTECYEEKQLLPTADEAEISCALTLGLEIDTKPKERAEQIGHDNSTVSGVACSKELNLLKVPNSGKLTAKARRRRLEIIKLKKINRRA